VIDGEYGGDDSVDPTCVRYLTTMDSIQADVSETESPAFEKQLWGLEFPVHFKFGPVLRMEGSISHRDRDVA